MTWMSVLGVQGRGLRHDRRAGSLFCKVCAALASLWVDLRSSHGAASLRMRLVGAHAPERRGPSRRKMVSTSQEAH